MVMAGNNVDEMIGMIIEEEFISKLPVCPTCRMTVVEGIEKFTCNTSSFSFPICACGSENRGDEFVATGGVYGRRHAIVTETTPTSLPGKAIRLANCICNNK